MPRNRTIFPPTPAPKTLPLLDARPVLGPYWLGTRFWCTVLADPDWWVTHRLPDPPASRLTDARHLNLIDWPWQPGHDCCPSPRPTRCDRLAPQRYHARSHSRQCPDYVVRGMYGLRPLPLGATV